MAYITERVIGMGFPSTGCETLYRNSLSDLKSFLDRYHGEYKIYNLCIEKNRIYPKNLWENKRVGLFPFNDHAPCPIKLILDFCIDLCLYLTLNPKGVAAIHCKAGKGRTGVMIVCYLIFSGLCENSDEALIHYAKQRTLNNKGVTIASQKRYIKYFETFLNANFERPFIKCIPKIIKFELNKGYTNMLLNYNTDMSYFTTLNSFKLKKCLIGPFTEEIDIEYDFSAITRKKLKFLRNKVTKKIVDQAFYYEIDICSDDVINYDLKLMIKGKKLNFYSWFNLWFSTFEIISNYIIDNNYFEDVQSQGLNINQALSRVETVETGLNHKNNILNTIAKKTHLKKFGKKTLSKAFQKIIAKYSKNKKKKSAIRTLKNNKDLNNILNTIDELAKEKNVKILDRKNLEFTIQRNQLDKLKTKNKDDFMIKYIYELLE
jgi:phosphatidylinositol-3,4,5-trisphosphate 3-phosphatase/dual-specificity protein phosphatase PTEN